jgi:hypothetical protein
MPYSHVKIYELSEERIATIFRMLLSGNPEDVGIGTERRD